MIVIRRIQILLSIMPGYLTYFFRSININKLSQNVFKSILALAAVLFLQSCQHSMESKREKKISDEKLSEAASFNTQLGLAYLKQGNRPRAKRKLLTALELAPDSPDVNAAMAYLLEKTGDMVEAKNFYKKALALAPNSGAQLNNYGTFLCRSGNYKEAERYFLKAVSDVHYVHSSGAYENAGLCATAIPDYAKAELYFSKALEQDPHRKQSLVELVTIELKENKPSKALEYLQKYPEIALNDSILLSMSVDAAHRLGKTELEAQYTERLSKNKNNADYAGEEYEYDNANG